MIRLTFTHAIDESPTIRTFYFKPERPLDYQAGQFIDIYLPHAADNKGDHRWFTLSSSPTEQEISVTADRPIPSARTSTFKQVLWRLQPGETAFASDPLGDFVLPLDSTTPLVWIAGGLSITPFRSFATWLKDTKDRRDIQLIHSIRSDDERIFVKQFEQAAIKRIHYINTSQESRLNAQSVLAIAQPNNSAHFYIAGSESMTESLSQDLQKHSIAKEHIITDAFLDYY